MNTGFIVAFSGSFDNGYPVDKETGLVNKSWHICDGTNGTPDLRGRFILGASDTYKVGSTGGEENTTLDVKHIPSHGHMIRTWNHVYMGFPKVYRNGSWERYTGGIFRVSGEWHNDGGSLQEAPQDGTGDPAGTTDGTGGGQPHNNMPPYYALSYIMKIG